MTETVHRHFSEWGPLDYARVFADRGFAFVRYKYRSCAEFAKVAMAEQNLGGQEVGFWVRWDVTLVHHQGRPRLTLEWYRSVAAADAQHSMVGAAPFIFYVCLQTVPISLHPLH